MVQIFYILKTSHSKLRFFSENPLIIITICIFWCYVGSTLNSAYFQQAIDLHIPEANSLKLFEYKHSKRMPTSPWQQL